MLNETLAQKLSARLIGARIRKGLSQSALAEKVGKSLRSVQNWEGGHAQPHGETLRKLCAELEVPMPYMLGEDMPNATVVPSQEQPEYKTSNASGVRGRVHQLLDQLLDAAGGDEGKLWWIYHELERHFADGPPSFNSRLKAVADQIEQEVFDKHHKGEKRK